VENAQPTCAEIGRQLERLNQLGHQYDQAQNRKEKIEIDQQFYPLYRWFREHTISLSYNEEDDIWTVTDTKG
jgi:hypothetical protein